MAREAAGGDPPVEASGDRSNGAAASWAYLTFSWRAHWRSLVVIALMLALAGGAAMAVAAGARRSATALERFEDEARTLDVFVAADITTPEPPAMTELLHGPLVEDANDLVFLFVDDGSEESFYFGATSRRGLDIERGVLLEGRRADPDEPHELVVTDAVARNKGVGVGDTIPLRSLTPAEGEALLETGELPAVPTGPRPVMEVVGIVRNGFTLVPGTGTQTLSITTPAFMEEYGGQIGAGSVSHMVRLVDEPGAVDEFTDAIAAAYGDQHLPSVNVGHGEQGSASDSIAVITAALVAVAVVIAVAGIAWVVAGVARHQRGAGADMEVLRAVGATPGQRRVLLAGMVAPAILAGPVVAIAVAISLSPLFPVGVARRVDPDPGLHADWATLALGVAILGVVMAAATALSAWLVVERGHRPAPATVRVPRLADRTARWLRPAPGTGVRFALHAPRRLSAPVRPALGGAVIGVVGLVAVAVVGSSLQRLVDTPARWGTTWDVAVQSATLDPEEVVNDIVMDNDDVDAAAMLLYDEQVTVDGVESIAMTLDPLKGDLTPAVVEGRAPRAPDEVALGRDTLDEVGASLGASVPVRARSSGAAEEYRVVGVIAFPAVGVPTAVAIGAAFTAEGGDRLLLGDSSLSDDAGTRYLALRWAPDVDHEAALASVTDRGVTVMPPTAPPEVDGLGDVRGFPMLAAGALVLLGVLATAHALIVTVRRRRQELGVLSALGFTPSMRRTVVVAQATTVACVALAIGIPLGAFLGRTVWSTIAEAMGVAGDPVTPLALLAAGAAGLVLALNAIAAVPGQAAYRLRAGEALRAE